MSGLIYDGGVAPRVKGKVYSLVRRAAMMYDVEIMALARRHKADLEVAVFCWGWPGWTE